MGKPQPRIYDPYYCAGAVVDRLKSLGFHDVYNRNEDCYKVWKERKEPSYDMIVTNPPFSGEPKEKCLRHCGNPKP
jgi:methylase of polypeptide subunit release factors